MDRLLNRPPPPPGFYATWPLAGATGFAADDADHAKALGNFARSLDAAFPPPDPPVVDPPRPAFNRDYVHNRHLQGLKLLLYRDRNARDLAALSLNEHGQKFLARRHLYPLPEDYEMACDALEAMASPTLLRLVEQLFPNPVDKPVVPGLFVLPRLLGSVPDDALPNMPSGPEYPKDLTHRAFFFQSTPWVSVGHLALGDLQDFYHWTVRVLVNPRRNLFRYTQDDVRFNYAEQYGAFTFPRLYTRTAWLSVFQDARPSGNGFLKLANDGAAEEDRRIRDADRVAGVVVLGRLLPMVSLQPPNTLIQGAAISTNLVLDERNFAQHFSTYLGDALQGFSALDSLWVPLAQIPAEPSRVAVIQALFESPTMRTFGEYWAQANRLRDPGFFDLVGSQERDATGAYLLLIPDAQRVRTLLGEVSPLAAFVLFLDQVMRIYGDHSVRRPRITRSALPVHHIS